MQTSDRVAAVLAKLPGFEQVRVIENTQLAGDASAREYRRIRLEGAPLPSVIFMKLAQGIGPVSSAGEQFNQDDTFVQVSQFLNQQGMGTPTVLWDGRAEGVLIVEDVGSVSLANLLLGSFTQAHQAVLAACQADIKETALMTWFGRAIDWILQLQNIKKDPTFVGFQRSIEAEHYLIESQRFVDYFLRPHGFDGQTISATQAVLKDVCRRVGGLNRTLVHRDFMAWNIQVDSKAMLRVIDFQDLTLGAYVYDLVSLLHDRDTDLLLGRTACQTLALYFKSQLGVGDAFLQDYACVVLQRYLRLAGQFALLTETTGKPIYQSWIPGCLKRVGHFLPILPEYKTFAQRLYGKIPLMALAAQNPWFSD